MRYERLDGPGRPPGSKYPTTTSSTAAAAELRTATAKLWEK